MQRHILTLLILPSLLALNGCSRLAIERHVVWAQLGTPAKIVHPKAIQILIPQTDAAGIVTWQTATGTLTGMIAIDEPTLIYYQDLDQQHKAAINSNK